MLKYRLKTPQRVFYGNMKNSSTAFTEIPFYKPVKLTYTVIECKPKNLICNYTRKVILCKPLWIFLLIHLTRHLKKIKLIYKKRYIYIFKDATWKLRTANIKRA